jgi:hypothetical protein
MSFNLDAIPSSDEIKQQLTEAAHELDQHFESKAIIKPKIELKKMKEFASLLNLLTFYIFQQSINNADSLETVKEISAILKTATNSLHEKKVLSDSSSSEYISISYSWYERLLTLLIQIEQVSSSSSGSMSSSPIDGGVLISRETLIAEFRGLLVECIPGLCGPRPK